MAKTAKTSAERQAEYRKKRAFAGPDGNGERRLNTWVSTGASLRLERLAVRYGVTKREMLERLIREADAAATSSMDDAEFDQYMKCVTR